MAPARLIDDTATTVQNGTHSHGDLPHQTPVLIVGGGPTGLLEAYLLSKLGVKSLIIERYARRLAAPKAHALSPRSLEICRQFGLDTAEIRRRGTPRAEAFWVNFVTSLSGEGVGRLPYERMDVGVLDDTPEMIHNIPQPMFEEFLTEQLVGDPNVEIRKNVSFVACRQSATSVHSTVEDRTTGETFEISSRHVIACDGARSKVRQALSVECEGEDSYETMMTIHFNADLKPVVGDRVGMLHWIMDPAVSGFIIGYDLSGNQVLICNFDAKKHPLDTWDEALCRETLTAAIGQETKFDVLSFRPWVLSRKVARQYRVKNVFLAGDAAHSFPPTGGLGLNSGLADVHNLAYKIAAVHKGWASDAILDSYQFDRRQVAMVNAQQSVKNGKKIFQLLKTVGTTGDNIEIARENLHRTIHDPAQGEAVDEGVEGQREHFDNLGLHIGYVYGRKAIPKNASLFTPECVPGARLPHTWISPLNFHALALPPVDVSYISEFDNSAAKVRQYSSLDLVDRESLTLITTKSSVWLSRYDKIIASLANHSVPFTLKVLGQDFAMVPGAAGEKWELLLGLKNGGGVLVRPDQHILMPLSSDTHVENIHATVRAHLGW